MGPDAVATSGPDRGSAADTSLSLDPVLLEQVVQRRAADAEQLGGGRDIALGPREREADRLAVGVLAHRLQRERRGRVLAEVEVGRVEQRVLGHDHRALHLVLELADVARPVPVVQCGERGRGEALERPAVVAAELREEVMREQRRVAVARGEARDADDDLGEAVEQILAETTGGDHLVEVLVRRADDADVDGDRLAPADPLDDALLEEAQQLDLEGEGDVADLVEEQRPALGELDLALGRLDRAGVRALLIAEQLGLEEVLGDCRAVDRDERLVLA